METAKLKSYAPAARKAFIAAVSAEAAKLGITSAGVEAATVDGEVLMVGGNALPRSIERPRKELAGRVANKGFDATMEAVAYTWFNRFVAIRYMELHGYLDHGFRVLSHPEGDGRPEILEHAADIELPGLNQAKAIELKLDGTQDEDLYRMLLIAQCNALHKAMPFLFERVGDESELLLPSNLLHTDSLIRQLFEGVEESAWQEIEVIGWLYQFYISEKKDEVIGKVVKSEDIPAATQLFTPNWIVKYMVQNSLGAQWMATYPESPLKGQMEYYIEPAEQTDEVNAQLAAITPKELNPEELTLIDPACGSGHILVEAYELFKAIYLERGYRQRDVAKLILEKNLFGLDIDERAAQLSGFALMMKGRGDDRRLFERGVALNVMALADSAGLDVEVLAKGVKLSDHGLKPGDLTELKGLFEHATTFGSLIQVPEELAEKLPALKQLTAKISEDLFVSEALRGLAPVVRQTELLAAHYDGVVANPPYMGKKFYCPALKKFVRRRYEPGRSDLYGAFTLRNIEFAKDHGHVGMITIPNWMFLKSFKSFRDVVATSAPISTLVHNGRGVWGSDFGSCSYVLRKAAPDSLSGRFLRLFQKQGSVAGNAELQRRFHTNGRFTISNSEFKRMPGSPVAYWTSEQLRRVFDTAVLLEEIASPRQGCATSDNGRFLRHWHEVQFANLGLRISSREKANQTGQRWFPYNKGGAFRKWSGNSDHVVNWKNDGAEIKDAVAAKYPYLNGNVDYVVKNRDCYFRESVSWSKVTSGGFALRHFEQGSVFDVSGCSIFAENGEQLYLLLGSMNSPVMGGALNSLSPTLNFEVGQVASFPIAESLTKRRDFIPTVKRLVSLAREDWNANERSWDFESLPLLSASSEALLTLEAGYTAWTHKIRDTIAEMKRLEEENNRLFIDAYDLGTELTPDVPIEQITLTVNPAYRYGGKLTAEEQWTRFREDTMEELVSYAIGCMMGRYSLDQPGLIYANSGNEGFDLSRYTTFPADDDGIVPLTDTEWFDDDATLRTVEFISVAWDESHLEENLTFLADNLSPKKNEASRDTIRRYINGKFFKDHLKTYKNRPIYWLFSSGKKKAFQALVYLHRYNEGTLARMRNDYVIPLQGKMAARIEQLGADAEAATSTAHRKALTKEKVKLEKQLIELVAFDEKLRHFADKRISLDLDDGVKVNYGKFGDLLVDVKAIHGKKPEAS